MIVYEAIAEGKVEKNKRRVERGGGIKIILNRFVPKTYYRAYRCLSGLVGFGRPIEFGLYRPGYFPERPGPLGTLATSYKKRGGSSTWVALQR